jgi:Family of unknown function (DUF5683)/PEGA domain
MRSPRALDGRRGGSLASAPPRTPGRSLVRSACILGITLLVAAAPAAAQAPAPRGSLTIRSRPSGASYELSGPQQIVGQTPATLTRAFSGRYQVTGTLPGWERWSGSFTFDGLAPDTVWMALRAKSRIKAAGRSLLLPGWGQFYAERPGRGWLWIGAGVASAGALVWTALEYDDAEDLYRVADYLYQNATTPAGAAAALEARNVAAAELDDALQSRRIATGVMAGVWALAALDAAIVLRPPGGAPVSLRLEPGLEAGRAEVLAVARVRF